MKKLFLVLMARALDAKTEEEINLLCGDIDFHFQHEKISWQEHELLYKLINRLS